MKAWDDVFAHRVCMANDAGCWLFMGAWTSAGYGNVGFERKNYLAHRLSFLLSGNALSKSAFLCHRCDTPACINPAHMFVGDAAANSEDMRRKRRSSHGAARPMAKLTDSDVLLIRASNAGAAELARQYGVTQGCIAQARQRLTWRHVA